MANLLEICELVWKQAINSSESDITREQFIATGKSLYAWEMWRLSKEENAREGFFDIPSSLLEEKELDVKDNVMDISGLKILRGLPNDTWLQNVGGLNSDCKYIATTVNRAQILSDDEFQVGFRTYIVIKDKIKFPNGVHKNSLPIIYASQGGDKDEWIEIDDTVGGIIRQKLRDVYIGKTAPEDTTNNSNPKI